MAKKAAKKAATNKSDPGGALASLVAAAAFVAVTVGSLRKPVAADASGATPPVGARPPLGATPPARLARVAPLESARPADRKAPPALLRKVDAWQRRTPVVGFPLAVARKFADDRAGYLAALVSYFAFFSLFPLLMALTSILGMVLEGREDWKDQITGTATEQIPIIGEQLSVGELTGSTVAVIVGIAVALWSGLRVIDAAQNALNDVWDVPILGRPKFAKRRAKSFLLLGVIGLSLVASLAAGTLGAYLPDLPGIGAVGIYVVTVGFNVGVFLLAFKLLSELDHTWGELLPGSIFAAIGWFVIQVPGAVYIQRTIDNSEGAYKNFATVIGLLTFFFLASQVVIVGAEINVVRKRRLWPRSLLARHGELTEGDKAVYAAAAGATRRLADQRVTVGYGYPPEQR